MKMTTPIMVPDTERVDVSPKAMYSQWIYLIAGTSALAAGSIFLALLRSDNWLVTIFKLQAGSNTVQLSQLYQLNGLDPALLVLVATAYAGLYCALHRSHRILALIALMQPPLGLLLFLLTHNAGRSSVMGAGLVISFAILGGGPFGKRLGWIGLLSSALLLAGDLGTDLAPSTALAIATGLGYVLLIAWLLAIGRRLLQLARKAAAEQG
jgi:hypothetical protein